MGHLEFIDSKKQLHGKVGNFCSMRDAPDRQTTYHHVGITYCLHFVHVVPLDGLIKKPATNMKYFFVNLFTADGVSVHYLSLQREGKFAVHSR